MAKSQIPLLGLPRQSPVYPSALFGCPLLPELQVPNAAKSYNSNVHKSLKYLRDQPKKNWAISCVLHPITRKARTDIY
jgi:hypothetical protein